MDYVYISLLLLLAAVLAFYVSLMFIFKYSTYIKRTLVFMNKFDSISPTLSDPHRASLKCVRQLRLRQDKSDIELGVWHILPRSRLPVGGDEGQADQSDEKKEVYIDDQQAFNDSRPIILYIHGNKGTRAGDHRVQLYHRLAYEFDYHVITFDYRGYGDSTYEPPTSSGLSSDALFMYKWLFDQPNVTHERVTVWGHSLGTAVACRMVSDLPAQLEPFKLVLESPFDTLAKAVVSHPYSMPFRPLPCFKFFFVDPITESFDFNFDSARNIVNIEKASIIIMHAQDDKIIPHSLGYNLFETALEKHGKDRVQFISLDGKLELGHRLIYKHNETMLKVKEFIEQH